MSLRDRLLDATVVASFDASGFRRHARRFDPDDLRVDLSGRRVLVTGATGGLGLATAQALADRGASVLVGSRQADRAAAACGRLRAAAPGPVDVAPAVFDVGLVADCNRWARAQDGLKIDVVIHNAGVLPAARSATTEGHEQALAANLLGPFALTWALRGALARSADPRIVWVSSGGMLTQRLDVAATFDPPAPYDGVVAYARTKRAEVVLAGLLQARFGPRVAVASMHPGWAATPGVARSLPRFSRLLGARLRSPAEGADTTVWLAARQPRPAPLGAFWFDRAVAPTHPLPGTRPPPGAPDRLWDRLCGAAGIDPGADWALPPA